MNAPDQRSKNIGIIAYLTIIGWIIALVMNNEKQSDYAAFHLRQMLGIMLTGLAINALTWIQFDYGSFHFADRILQALILVIWLFGFIPALQGEKKPVPFLGEYYQEWFKSLG